jgi:hypothetical protein
VREEEKVLAPLRGGEAGARGVEGFVTNVAGIVTNDAARLIARAEGGAAARTTGRGMVRNAMGGVASPAWPAKTTGFGYSVAAFTPW